MHEPLYSYTGRRKGKAAYEIWSKSLLEKEQGQPLWLTFPEDQLVDPSFAEESIIKLGREIVNKEFGKKCLRLQGLTDDSITNINAIIKWHAHNVVFIAGRSRKEWQVIGHPLGKELSKIFELVKEQGSITSSAVASSSKIAINAASNQLHRLYNLRLLWRKKETFERGVEYVYSIWL